MINSPGWVRGVEEGSRGTEDNRHSPPGNASSSDKCHSFSRSINHYFQQYHCATKFHQYSIIDNVTSSYQ